MDAFDVKTIAINLATLPTGGTVMAPILKAPSATQGGGITILAAEHWPSTATNAGTAYQLELVNGGTLGTALGGTVGSAVGGTAAPETANTAYPFTIQTGSNINMLAASQYLSVRKIQQGGTSNADGILLLSYINGK